MHYRSVANLSQDIHAWSFQVPKADLVVGVPRSGLLAASLLALFWNVPVLTLSEWTAESSPYAGERLSGRTPGEVKSVLIVDDSTNSGRELERVKAQVEGHTTSASVFFGAVYTTKESRKSLDYWFEEIPHPRVFEWNVLGHGVLANACVDIDGLLCEDPTDFENDDGGNYRHFLESAKPKYLPSVPVGTLVTNRLERYRAPTVQWLKRYGITYSDLVMLDLPDAEARRREGPYVQHKASAYKRSGALIFLESEEWQASAIAASAGLPVLCTSNWEMYYRGGLSRGNPSPMDLIIWRSREKLRRGLCLVRRSTRGSGARD